MEASPESEFRWAVEINCQPQVELGRSAVGFPFQLSELPAQFIKPVAPLAEEVEGFSFFIFRAVAGPLHFGRL